MGLNNSITFKNINQPIKNDILRKINQMICLDSGKLLNLYEIKNVLQNNEFYFHAADDYNCLKILEKLNSKNEDFRKTLKDDFNFLKNINNSFQIGHFVFVCEIKDIHIKNEISKQKYQFIYLDDLGYPKNVKIKYIIETFEEYTNYSDSFSKYDLMCVLDLKKNKFQTWKQVSFKEELKKLDLWSIGTSLQNLIEFFNLKSKNIINIPERNDIFATKDLFSSYLKDSYNIFIAGKLTNLKTNFISENLIQIKNGNIELYYFYVIRKS